MKNNNSDPVIGTTAYFEQLPNRVVRRMQRRKSKKWATLALLPMTMGMLFFLPWNSPSRPEREEIVSYLEQEEYLDHEVWFELAETHQNLQP